LHLAHINEGNIDLMFTQTSYGGFFKEQIELDEKLVMLLM